MYVFGWIYHNHPHHHQHNHRHNDQHLHHQPVPQLAYIFTGQKIFTTGYKTFLCLSDLYLSSYYEKTGLDPPLLLFDFHVIGFPIKDRRYQWTVHNLTLKKTNIILYKILTWRAIIWDLFDDFLSSDLPRGE